MPILNFQKQFAAAVESGEKSQTIRAPRKHPIRVGDTLYLYTGLRTKSVRKLGEAKCRSVVRVFIPRGGVHLVVDNKELLYLDQLNPFAQSDGFEDWYEMVRWFEKNHGLPFVGMLIKW